MMSGRRSGLQVINVLSAAQLQELHALYQDEWWTKGRTLAETQSVVAGSQICIGLADETGRLIAFSRVLTDFTFKALIFDVIVAPAYRERGLGDQLMTLILGHEKLRDVRSMELYCLPELAPFYQRHGFVDDGGKLRIMRRPHSQGRELQ
jgi:predicted GNAT family N-acyltransferase